MRSSAPQAVQRFVAGTPAQTVQTCWANPSGACGTLASSMVTRQTAFSLRSVIVVMATIVVAGCQAGSPVPGGTAGAGSVGGTYTGKGCRRRRTADA
jgi:hypothetical protein